MPRRRGKPRADARALISANPSTVRKIVSRAAGVLRDGDGLAAAAADLLPLALNRGEASDPACVALMVVIAALRRRESRGAHARTDFPSRAAHGQRSTLRLDEALAAAREIVPETVG
jgi:L-aspartate oxidase